MKRESPSLPTVSPSIAGPGQRKGAGGTSCPATSVPQRHARESQPGYGTASAGIHIQPFERSGNQLLPIVWPLTLALVASIAVVGIAAIAATGAFSPVIQ